ncbi:hypothetical protein ATK17_2787 [Branchiibius hedensis]|uniref:Uncharacterized protein n=1 Tax=Branchiibius hedensis TaxID=672460 RepID=A0A2Y9BUB1_9MICO|nr:DUF6349 family protein [Branchiibius hedensis]PWJ26620.1 hypothetical protein ATK17_2787 [Branchiibius hedensis]SSA35432.1 hypothetical protein SAMN04489750_2787 [Branchiibius hedensis]
MAKGSTHKGKKRGSDHEVVELPLKGKAKDDPPTEDVGSFTFGYCTSCDWRGRARRSRDKAREDARDHRVECDGKGKVHVGATDTKKVDGLPLP